VKDWLKGLGLARYVAPLQAEGLDHFSIIKDLDDDSIDHLITICMMPRLHARQFRNGLEKLRAEGTHNGQEKLESDATTNMSMLETTAGQTADSADGSQSGDTQVAIASNTDETKQQDNNDEDDDLLDEGKHKRKAGIVLNKTCSKSAEKKRKRKVNKKVKTELEADAYVRELIEKFWKSSVSDPSEA
jgi:hypothetical protein